MEFGKMRIFDLFQRSSIEKRDVDFVIHYNKLKDLVMSNRYTEAISYITVYQSYVYVKELYKIVLIYGSLPAFLYYTNYFVTQDLAGKDGISSGYFTRMISRYPLHTMLLKSVVNMVNVEYFEALFDYFPQSRPTFANLLQVMERGNVDLLRLYAGKIDHLQLSPILMGGARDGGQSHDDEGIYESELKLIEHFDMKRFVYSLKYECDAEFIHKVSEVVRMIPLLRELVIERLMDPGSSAFISKEYFLESLFKSILDKGFEFADKDQYISKNFSFVRSNSSTNSLHDLI